MVGEEEGDEVVKKAWVKKHMKEAERVGVEVRVEKNGMQTVKFLLHMRMLQKETIKKMGMKMSWKMKEGGVEEEVALLEAG